jgi:hypothetical protein
MMEQRRERNFSTRGSYRISIPIARRSTAQNDGAAMREELLNKGKL